MQNSFTRYGFLAILCYVLLVTVPAVAGAQIIQGQDVTYDFTRPDLVKDRMEYSDHDRLGLSPKGLGWEGDENHIVSDAWFQTTEPIALGYAWTPTSGVTIHAHIDVDFAHIGVYSLGTLYVRYSPDAKNWSSWQVLEGSSRPDKSKRTHDYEGQIVIPQRVRKSYYALLQTFYKANPKMVGDEEEAVRWIVKNDPHYFEKTIPFVGYIQFLFESSLLGGQHIKSMHNLVIWTLPGLHMASQRELQQDPKKPVLPWQYRAQPLLQDSK